MKRARFAWVPAMLAMAALGCGGSGGGGSSGSGSVPTIHLLYPTDGVTMSLSAVTAAVSVENFTLDPAEFGGPDVPGHGHWHLLVDGATLGMSATSGIAVDLAPDNVTAGAHTLAVELHTNTHAIVSPQLQVPPSVRVTLQ